MSPKIPPQIRGSETFREYLAGLRDRGAAEPPRELLGDQRASEPFESDVRIDQRKFSTRLDAGRYFTELFKTLTGLEEDVGLWSWLSLFYFDQVCPPKPDGTRSPGRDYRHVLEPGYPYGHRHLLAGPFLVYRLHGEEGKLLLCTRLTVENGFHHQIASRQALISNGAIIRALNLLYWDDRAEKPKRGAQANGARGTLLRFIDVIQQLDMNYDLYSMSAEAIVELLPSEFDEWKPRKRRLRFRPRK